jgi:hypothetical protein
MYSDEELLRRLKLLTWDTTLKPEDLLMVLKDNSTAIDQPVKLNLYIKILNWFSWHEVRFMVEEDKLPNLLAEEVIRGLFPRDLRDKYRYVKSLL